MEYSESESIETPLIENDNENYSSGVDGLSSANDTSSSASALAPSLNEINYINLFTFIINFIVTYWVGVAGVGTLPNNAELSMKYQTIVTPVGWAFSIWSVIFIAQGFFAIIQMLPRYRRSKLIQIGINYWYFFASLFQVGWTITFSFELIPISLVMMLFILASLIGLLISEGTVKHRENSWQEYWFLEFPFEVLTGWIIAAFVVNINVLVVHLNASESIQLVTGIISLVSLFIVGIVMTCFPKEPTFVIPIVMAWATAGINAELRSPADSICDSFSKNTIDGIKTAAMAASIIILLQIAVRISYHFTAHRRRN